MNTGEYIKIQSMSIAQSEYKFLIQSVYMKKVMCDIKVKYQWGEKVWTT